MASAASFRRCPTQRSFARGPESRLRSHWDSIAKTRIRDCQDQAIRIEAVGVEFGGSVQEYHCAGQVNWHQGCDVRPLWVLSFVVSTFFSIIAPAFRIPIYSRFTLMWYCTLFGGWKALYSAAICTLQFNYSGLDT